MFVFLNVERRTVKLVFPYLFGFRKHSLALNQSANQISFHSNVCICYGNKHTALSAYILYTNLSLAHIGWEFCIQRCSEPEEHINIHEIVISLSGPGCSILTVSFLCRLGSDKQMK